MWRLVCVVTLTIVASPTVRQPVSQSVHPSQNLLVDLANFVYVGIVDIDPADSALLTLALALTLPLIACAKRLLEFLVLEKNANGECTDQRLK